MDTDYYDRWWDCGIRSEIMDEKRDEVISVLAEQLEISPISATVLIEDAVALVHTTNRALKVKLQGLKAACRSLS
jgi:hypothetical protein